MKAANTIGRAIQRLGVVGAGQMGTGIAIVAARQNIPVSLVDTSEGVLSKARNFAEGWAKKEVEKGRMQPA